MIWLIEIALVLLLIGGGWTMLTRGKQSDKRDALTMRRVDAYIETIRRERRSAELAAMSDTELRDLLHSGARNLKIAAQRKSWIVMGTAIATVLGASVVGSQEGWLGFGAVAAIGAIVTYGANEYLARRMRAPLERRGVDIDRLMVE
ncbi:hypothetical protein NIM87_10265 [Devosia sp. XJ19-1]|uniref:Uncharacterized protein n=1 Tax=Devosia ureilytica TaxID=2952754 RepID=A0A9Q4APT7_9HYPH|nr:hypothetical protein [Devosia ureilytica]MCP8883884.1 hypothetical protein [Devosia ureilytica]MCP8887492.1 hypothetical protein [Devosia ureilytica]